MSLETHNHQSKTHDPDPTAAATPDTSPISPSVTTLAPVSERPTVSVVIPTYNHAQYLSETLDSVLAQTFPISEIIVVNDGSPDDTDSAIAPYLHLPQLRYIKQTNHGQAHARNTGLSLATGELISFLDDDDTWPPEKTARQIELLRQNPTWVAVGGIYGEIIDGLYTEPQYFFKGPLASFENLFMSCPFISPGVVLIRHDAMKLVGGFDPAIWGCDDWDLWIRLGTQGSIGTVNECALRYRNHPANASRQRHRMLKSAMLVAEKNHALAFPSNPTLGKRRMFKIIFHWAGYSELSNLRQLKFPTRDVLKVWGQLLRRSLTDSDVRHALFAAAIDLVSLGSRWAIRTVWQKIWAVFIKRSPLNLATLSS